MAGVVSLDVSVFLLVEKEMANLTTQRIFSPQRRSMRLFQRHRPRSNPVQFSLGDGAAKIWIAAVAAIKIDHRTFFVVFEMATVQIRLSVRRRSFRELYPRFYR